MLRIIQQLSALSYSKLMALYTESNLKQGKALLPCGSAPEQRLAGEQDYYAYLRDIFFPTPGAVLCLWEQDGQYISGLRLEPYQDGLLITGLETLPEMRGQGYAHRLLDAVCAEFSGQHVILYAHVKKGNTISLRAHADSGFRRSAEYGVLLNGSVSREYCTLKKEL